MDISRNGLLIAKHILAADLGSPGLTFHSDHTDGVQVGVWNYDEAKILQPHIHNEHEKISDRTAEVLYVIKGSVHADIYDETATLISELTINEGDILICLVGGHGYQILEDRTIVLEVKNGPYFGPEQDRRRIESQCRL